MKRTPNSITDLYVATVEQPACEEMPLPQGGAHPLVAEVRRLVLSMLEERVQKMFRGADEILIAMSDKAESPVLQHAHFDAIRALQLEQGQLTRQFRRELERAFDPSAVAAAPSRPGHLVLLPEQEVEENISWSRITARCKTRHKAALELLEPRVEELGRNLSLPLTMRMLAPARICDAWRACLDTLDLGFNVRRIFVQLFEATVMSDLAEYYASLLGLLDRHDGRRPAASPAPMASALPATSRPRALRALQAVATGSVHGAADLRFALDLIARLRAEPAGPASQRADLVGTLLGELVADPHLPPAYTAAVESWCYPLLKAALADDSFFSNPAQPVRQLLNQQMLRAVTARIEGPLAAQRTGDQLRALSESFNVSADFARPALKLRTLLRPAQVTEFFQQLQGEATQRRAELLARTRRAVAQALESKILGRALPSQLDEILRNGVGPLLARRLLREGHGSAAWNDAIERVGLMLDSASNSDEMRQRDAVVSSLAADLKEAGLAPDRIVQLVGGLRAHYRVLDAEAPRPASAAAVETIAAANDPLPEHADVLLQLLQPEQWFQIYDPVRSESCWMKVRAYLPQEKSIDFIDFSAQKTLRVRAADFISDLKTRRSGPVGASAGVQQALARLMAA